jgi:acetyl-CoA synthetase
VRFANVLKEIGVGRGTPVAIWSDLLAAIAPSRCAAARRAEHVGQKIGKLARPANVVFTPELPKTRSGKIMRRLLRDVAENRELGDITTLAGGSVGWHQG